MDKKEAKKMVAGAVDEYLRIHLPGLPIRRKGYSWFVVSEGVTHEYEVDFPAGFLSPSQMSYFTIAFKRMNREKTQVIYYKVPTEFRKMMVENYCRHYEAAMHEAGVKNFKVSSIKKFSIRTWWGKEQIHFQDMDELKKWLQTLIPKSAETFMKVAGL